MHNFSLFYFKSFEFDYSNLQAKFHYSFDDEVFFDEILDFHNEKFKLIENIDKNILENILFHLHIAIWISYYKAYPTSDLIIESGYLDEFQIKFWQKFYTNWLWEYLYTNQLSPKWLFNFINKSKKPRKNYLIENNEVFNSVSVKNKKSLISIWWGKDSIVSIELMKNAWMNFDLFVFWKIDQLKQFTSDISGNKILSVRRQLSDTLFELNKLWYYNWHVPITWIIAFAMQVVAYLYDYEYLILSNEKSASFWNTVWEWVNINHQYSKSLDFEKDFSEYVFKYISKKSSYFSLLRWMYEVKIAQLFTKYWKKYFKNFSSCNNNFKINKNSSLSPYQKARERKMSLIYWSQKYWCNSCPKCAFVYSILRPYLSKSEILDIFWEDLYERSDLEKLFRELLWISGIKPFECVWEAEEVIYSMYLTIKNHYYIPFLKEENVSWWTKKSISLNNNLPFILQIFENEVLIKFDLKKIENIEKKLVTIYNDDIIPSLLKDIIFKKN